MFLKLETTGENFLFSRRNHLLGGLLLRHVVALAGHITVNVSLDVSEYVRSIALVIPRWPVVDISWFSFSDEVNWVFWETGDAGAVYDIPWAAQAPGTTVKSAGRRGFRETVSTKRLSLPFLPFFVAFPIEKLHELLAGSTTPSSSMRSTSVLMIFCLLRSWGRCLCFIGFGWDLYKSDGNRV